MDFSVLENFSKLYNKFYDFLISFMDFFDEKDKDINFDYTDKNGNEHKKSVPTIGKIKKEIKNDVFARLLSYNKFIKISNQFFEGKINYEILKTPNKSNKLYTINLHIDGLSKTINLNNIIVNNEFDIDFTYNNYLYYDINNNRPLILNKPFKIGYTSNLSIVNKNYRFSKINDIVCHSCPVKDIEKFFNDPFKEHILDIKFINTDNHKDDYVEIFFELPKKLNINKYFIRTDYYGKIELLGSVNNKLFKKLNTYSTPISQNSHKKSNEEGININNIVIDFENDKYFKFYKLRFYNEKNRENYIKSFKIFDLELLTTNLIWLDTTKNSIKEYIENIFIEKNLLYLGEFELIDDLIGPKLNLKKYHTKNTFVTDFKKYLFGICIDNPFKDENVQIKIYISNIIGNIKEDGTEYFKILYNSEKIEIRLHPDAYIELKEFYYSIEITRTDYEYIGN